MPKKKKQKWVCARCARRKNVEPETDPVVLRVCDWCSIENWVRPVGHGGANAGSGRVMEKKVSADGEALPVYKKGEVAESIPSEIAPLIQPVKIKAKVSEDAKIDFEKEEITVTVELEAEPENETMTPKEKEIADLKAQLEELEK